MEKRLKAAATALLVLVLGLAERAPEAQKREIFSGSALLYSVPEVTVVYPAGPGEDRERNRISAERRAAYLRGRHNTETRVVADIEITDEERRAHLLLLGWNNQLLRETGVVEFSEDGWKFEGIQRGFDRDLLFSWVSPFNGLSELFFWSRIDPELDRYLVLPFFGSDWIVFERYTIEQYGRFDRAELTWPPKRNPDVEVDNREVRPQIPATRVSEHYQLHDLTLGLGEGQAERILQTRESAWKRSVAALGKTPDGGEKIKLFLYEDSESKELLCDVHDARHHMPRSGELHLTKAIAMDPSPHEDFHLVARRLLGPGFLTVLVEGLAVWAEQQQGDNELPVYANMLAGRVELPGIESLLDEETMRVMVRQRTGFPVAGLFVAWLHEVAGPEAIQKAYGFYSGDPREFAAIVGVSLDEIDESFAAFVQSQAKLGESEAAFREATARAQHFGGLGDYERAIPALERALEFRPGHLFTRYSLAVARMEIDDLENAESDFRALLKQHDQTPDDGLALLAWYRLGQLHRKRDESEPARQAYRKALELPDFRGMHGRVHEALAEIDRE